MKWLILRGLVREQRHWHEFKGILEGKLKSIDPSAEVHAIDMAGFGTEIERVSAKTIAGIVDDLRQRWNLLKKTPDEEWGVLAVSLGGMVTACWISRYPEDFKKAVLINSSMSGLSPIQDRMKPSNYSKIFKLLLSTDLVQREMTILSMTTNFPKDRIRARAEKQAPYGQNVNKMNAVYQIMAAIRFKAPERIVTPMIVLVGDGDQLVSPRCSEAIARQYQAKLIRHPTGNHDLTADAPEWVADQVGAWA